MLEGETPETRRAGKSVMAEVTPDILSVHEIILAFIGDSVNSNHLQARSLKKFFFYK